MPVFNFKCPSCDYILEDVLCTYVEAQGKVCTKCKQRVMKIVPNGTPAVSWRGDTDFSASKKRETQ